MFTVRQLKQQDLLDLSWEHASLVTQGFFAALYMPTNDCKVPQVLILGLQINLCE